jgi:ATP-dependent Clp endopeptidase proteolytic subunit ClpP
MASKKTKQVEQESESIVIPEIPAMENLLVMPPPQPPQGLRSVALFGDVHEENAGEVIYAMLALREQGRFEEEVKGKKGKSSVVTKYDPFEFYLSTHGGSASDMFAIYDVMRQVKKDCDISTIGIGKVMSAGVLLLAAGTKGKRKIGKHCRVMIHSVLGGNEGPLFNLENELDQVRWVQEKYVEALIAESKMTSGTMKKLLEKHVNIYLSAEEAVKYGIADEVI